MIQKSNIYIYINICTCFSPISQRDAVCLFEAPQMSWVGWKSTLNGHGFATENRQTWGLKNAGPVDTPEKWSFSVESEPFWFNQHTWNWIREYQNGMYNRKQGRSKRGGFFEARGGEDTGYIPFTCIYSTWCAKAILLCIYIYTYGYISTMGIHMYNIMLWIVPSG